MKLIDRIKDRLVGAVAGYQIGESGLDHVALLKEEAIIRANEAEDSRSAGVPMISSKSELDSMAKEAAGLADIELNLEDQGWRDLSGVKTDLSRTAIRRMMGLSRVMYLVNPLIKRAVTVQELYVWGQPPTIKADSDKVQKVIDAFFKNRKNQQVIGASFPERERDQRIDGNTFFVFFLNRVNGEARVRLIPVDEVSDIITNPNDRMEPWFYLRELATPDGQGSRILYPDIDYLPPAGQGQYPASYDHPQLGKLPIKWDAKVLHVKTGGLSTMKFGVPELFAALGWATAYKKILENFATILAAYARVAMQLKNMAGKKNVAAAKAKLGTGINGTTATDTNPPSNTASWFLASGGVELSAVKTAHSTTGPDEARALRSMVAAGSDTPEHFFGDSDIGNFATSTTLDRPTELKMVSRQRMWGDVIVHICEKLVEWSSYYQFGQLHGQGFRAELVRDPFDGSTLIKVTPPRGQTTEVLVTFPNILDRDVVDKVRAVVQAATLGGSKAEGIFPNRKTLAQMLFTALGEKNAEKMANEMYPSEVTQGFADPAKELEIQALKAKKAAQKPAASSGT